VATGAIIFSWNVSLTITSPSSK